MSGHGAAAGRRPDGGREGQGGSGVRPYRAAARHGHPAFAVWFLRAGAGRYFGSFSVSLGPPGVELSVSEQETWSSPRRVYVWCAGYSA